MPPSPAIEGVRPGEAVYRAVQIANECESKMAAALRNYDEQWAKLKAECSPQASIIIDMLPSPWGYFKTAAINKDPLLVGPSDPERSQTADGG